MTPEPSTFTPRFTARLGDRSLFPALEARAYLNHAGIAPPSTAVADAMARLVASYTRAGAAAYPEWLAQRQRLKGKLGQLLNVRGEDLALVQSTTWGIVDVALCFPWQPGDRVIVFAGEFPSNVTPWQRAAALFGVEVVVLSADDYRADVARALARLTEELDRGARLVAVSAVEFQTGFRMPTAQITRLAHARGAEVLVDAVQACGAVPLDAAAEGFDYLASGGHKWMMSVEGTGFLYVRPDRAAALRPAVAGWLSHEHAIDFLFEGPGHLRYDRPIKRSIDFLEIGNVNAAGFAGMEAALDLIQQLGVSTIFDHVNGYLDALETGLLARGFESARAKDPAHRSCTLSVRPGPAVARSVIELHRALAARGVATATPDGWLRFSPHWPNALAEVPAVLAALDEALAAPPA